MRAEPQPEALCHSQPPAPLLTRPFLAGVGVLWAHGAATLLGARVRRRHCLSAATTPAGPPQALDARLSLLLWANLASHVALTAREVHFHVTFPLNYPLTFSVDISVVSQVNVPVPAGHLPAPPRAAPQPRLFGPAPLP